MEVKDRGIVAAEDTQMVAAAAAAAVAVVGHTPLQKRLQNREAADPSSAFLDELPAKEN